MTPEGVDEDQARQWATAMDGIFSMFSSVWLASLDEPLEQAPGLLSVTQTVT